VHSNLFQIFPLTEYNAQCDRHLMCKPY